MEARAKRAFAIVAAVGLALSSIAFSVASIHLSVVAASAAGSGASGGLQSVDAALAGSGGGSAAAGDALDPAPEGEASSRAGLGGDAGARSNQYTDGKVRRGEAVERGGGLKSRPYQALEADAACSAGATVRTYNVSAINVDIPINQFGDHDPKGRMYVLDSRIDDVREQEESQEVTAGLHNDPIQPLVIRANLGDCVRLQFTNRLDGERASIHVHRGKIPPGESGSHVGTNEDTTVAPGGSTTYTFQIEEDPQLEGTWYFHSHGNRKQVGHGLFGGLIVEPKGSVWLDPHTGEPKLSGWAAMINNPNDDLPAFREHVIFYHSFGDDTFRLRDKNGDKLPLVDDTTGVYRPGSKALNYRSVPHRRRMQLLEGNVSDQRNPSNFDESLAYSSYTFGEPATPMPQAYLGDPTKIRILNGGSEVNHVHHLHGGGIRWRFQPDADSHSNYMFRNLTKNPNNASLRGNLSDVNTSDIESDSQRLDSQSIAPGETYTNEIACGAGGCQRSAGEFLYHCHVADHYISGMWAFWRVYDTKQSHLRDLPGREGETPEPVASTELIGTTLPSGKTLTEDNIDEWVQSQLPPQGVPEGYDPTVWNWKMKNTSEGPLYLGEPLDTKTWPAYDADDPGKYIQKLDAGAGERPVIEFNPENGRIAFPLLTPHLGKRPPFAPGHGPAPYLSTVEAPNDMATNSDHDTVRADPNRPSDQLCPPGSPVKRMNIVAIQTPVQLNDETTMERGMVFVLAENKEAMLSGERPVKPLVYRANVGDCVEITLTSELKDNDINHDFSKVNIHPHFIQFDVQSTDGVITGRNYETSVRPYPTENRTLTEPVSAGDTTINVTNTDGLRPGTLVGVGLGTNDIEIHRIKAIRGNTLVLNESIVRDHPEDHAVGVEFVRYRYYLDANFGTVFFHDHVIAHKSFPRGLFGALVAEPRNSTYHDPRTGERIRQGPIADIHTDTQNRVAEAAGSEGESYREAVMLLANNRHEDIGVGSWINLRAEPFEDRGESAVLSSVRNGDPATPIVRAYEGDPVVFRVLDSGPSDSFTFRITGHRFRLEHFPNATRRQTIHIGPSERFDLMIDGGAGQAGDYLYYVPQADHFRDGMWGIFRVHDTRQSTLEPLPDRPAPPEGEGFPTLETTGKLPPDPAGPGTPCPADAPVREFNVSATARDVVFNNETGMKETMTIYTLESTDSAHPKPAVLRAAEGECVEVHVTNELDERITLHVGDTEYDPRNSSGITVGYNYDQAAEPGETRTYRVYVDEDVGAGVVADFSLAGRFSPTAAFKNGELYGMYGAIVTAPENATFHDPATGERIKAGTKAVVHTDDGLYRDHALLFHEQDPTIGTHQMPYDEELDGVAAVNYRSEPFEDRLDEAGPSKVYDSDTHGDPETPIVRAYEGDPVRIHAVYGFGFQYGVFSLQGHSWPHDRRVADSTLFGARQFGPHEIVEVSVHGGAGRPGDYLYQNHRLPYTEGGQWGLFRVHGETQSDLLTLEEVDEKAATNATDG